MLKILPMLRKKANRLWQREQSPAPVLRKYDRMTRQALAQEIINRYRKKSATGRFINLRGWAENMTDTNRRSVFANLEDTAAGKVATTRPALRNGKAVPDTYLSDHLLRAILCINDQFGDITINALAGGDHTQSLNDEHYLGVAADFQSVRSYVLGTNVRPEQILDYLENEQGFKTQRNSIQAKHRSYIGNTRHFHLEIWGRE